ncbi:carbohydrate-binding module family 50 protein [Moniliophthora roreri MCA 2997]|uniref:Carbohydrate-binding module family 50 protein n=2 Tax=Moniliophthora roreri TaxID=221103 RepID=V2WUC1_MONRO|nr:carbohydrate-binding module family 50 protein [Moniliophthora roreri MCA 2997]KAI3607984.1 carbohydrate-binding module family 50 protein [Moniliophthora roreri]
MSNWSQFDEDAYRLPEGFKRIGYDSDTGRYLFEDREGHKYRSEPYSEFGTLTRVPDVYEELAKRTKPSLNIRTHTGGPANSFYDFLTPQQIAAPNKLSPPPVKNNYGTIPRSPKATKSSIIPKMKNFFSLRSKTLPPGFASAKLEDPSSVDTLLAKEPQEMSEKQKGPVWLNSLSAGSVAPSVSFRPLTDEEHQAGTSRNVNIETDVDEAPPPKPLVRTMVDLRSPSPPDVPRACSVSQRILDDPFNTPVPRVLPLSRADSSSSASSAETYSTSSPLTPRDSVLCDSAAIKAFPSPPGYWIPPTKAPCSPTRPDLSRSLPRVSTSPSKVVAAEHDTHHLTHTVPVSRSKSTSRMATTHAPNSNTDLHL